MRRLGGLAAAVGITTLSLAALTFTAAAAPVSRSPVIVSLTLSRAHGVLTVVVKNQGSTPVCIDPNYAASARIMAFARDGRPLKNPSAVEGHARNECLQVDGHKATHLVYDTQRLYPFGLPGDSRICWGAWWKAGPVGSKAPVQKVGRCAPVPPEGLGRR